MPEFKQIEFALAHPVFDPARQITPGHYWAAERDVSACLTVNIGMEWQVYAGGRPLWHLSLAAHDLKRKAPVAVSSWSPNLWRKMEALRDQIMFNHGTSEPWIAEDIVERDPDDMMGGRRLEGEEFAARKAELEAIENARRREELD